MTERQLLNPATATEEEIAAAQQIVQESLRNRSSPDKFMHLPARPDAPSLLERLRQLSELDDE